MNNVIASTIVVPALVNKFDQHCAPPFQSSARTSLEHQASIATCPMDDSCCEGQAIHSNHTSILDVRF